MSTKDQDTTNLLRELYYDPKRGLFNAVKLYQKVKELGIKLGQVRDFITKQKTGQLYKGPTEKSYYPITAPSGSFQADLIFYPKTKVVNRGYDTALTLIEITSRMGYCIPMKGKKTTQVIEAMKRFLDIPKVEIHNITTDKGSEFISASWKKLMEHHNINHILADEGDHHKMGMIERFNRTIKSLISKYQTTYKTTKWIDALDDLVENYNTTVHSATSLAPAQVTPKDRVLIRFHAAQTTAKLDQKKNLNVGDKVRILQQKAVFGKEGPKWSDEVYTIVEDNTKSFKLDGLHKRYKHYQLQRVDFPAEENPHLKAKPVVVPKKAAPKKVAPKEKLVQPQPPRRSKRRTKKQVFGQEWIS